MYYRDASGDFSSLSLGTVNQILSVSGGLPSWQSLNGSVNNMDGGNATSVYGGTFVINGGGA